MCECKGFSGKTIRAKFSISREFQKEKLWTASTVIADY